ncbi:MAG: bifunctional adenosylcobinamide kinase/adenosylcobinamide-phosphate guanylyltransferase [Steroidobacteraceae bacterium]
MKQLILGGVRSGKSRLAEERARASGRQVIYVATALNGGDAQMEERILRHRTHRPPEWITIEEPYALGTVLLANDSHDRCLLVECLTLWLTNLLCVRPERLDEERRSLCDAVAQHRGALILVSNETGLGVVPMGELSRRFLDASGELHQALASLCDRVTLTVAGLPLELKGAPS